MLPDEKIPEGKLTVSGRIICDVDELVLQPHFFFLDLSEFASDRIDLVFLPFDDGIENRLQLIQGYAVQKIFRFGFRFVFENFLRSRILFIEGLFCFGHPFAQFIRHILVDLVFEKLLDELISRIDFFALFVDLRRKKHFAFNGDQFRCHYHEFAHDVQIFGLHLSDIFQVLVRYLYDRDIENIDLILVDQVQEQVQRTVKHRQFYID